MGEEMRTCTGCGVSKPARAYYESCPSCCMACKRARSKAHKDGSGYNVAYGRHKRNYEALRKAVERVLPYLPNMEPKGASAHTESCVSAWELRKLLERQGPL